jgi:hypothetical protein
VLQTTGASEPEKTGLTGTEPAKTGRSERFGGLFFYFFPLFNLVMSFHFLFIENDQIRTRKKKRIKLV